MKTVVEKNFSPDIKVVKAVNSLKSNYLHLLGGTILIIFFGWMLGYMLFSKSSIEGFWHWMLILVLALVLYLMASGVYTALKEIRQRKKLEQQGIATQATVVGRELDERNEENIYLVYFQFHPDFVVQYQDNTPNNQFFQLPMSSTLSILYLSDNPEVIAVLNG